MGPQLSRGMASSLWFVLAAHPAHLVYQKAIPANTVSVDSSSNVYIANNSGVTKLDPTGNVVYTTPLAIAGAAIASAVDSAGDLILVGSTNSDTVPTTAGVFQPQRSPGVCIAGDKSAQQYPCPDAFIVKLDAAGKLAWASYLGGLNIDQASAVAVDPSGNVYVTGLTQSADFPSVNGFQPKFGGYADAFVTKIRADGTAILYSSFLGGSGYDVAHAIAVDSAGYAYVAGQAQGVVPPIAGTGFGGACGANSVSGFLAKVSPAGDRLVFSGCFTPNDLSSATAVTLDRQGNIYVGGSGGSRTSFPSTPGAYRSIGNSPYVNFLDKIAPDGSFAIYSALFDGGSFGVYSLGIDASGAVYLTGDVESQVFPAVGPAMQPCPVPDNLDQYFLLKLKPDGSAPLYSSFAAAGRSALAPDGSLHLAGASLQKLTALELPGDSFLSPNCVLSGASFASHVQPGEPGISPGELLTLKGTGLGPLIPPTPLARNGAIAAALGGVQVLFDGVAAPLLYVQDAQLNVIAPYEIAGKTQTVIQVQYQGQSTQPVTIPVSPTSAAPFQNAILNSDYSANSQTNPAARGDILIVYMTGAGQTSPPSIDGQIWQTTGGLQAQVSAQLKNYGAYGVVAAPLTVTYAGPVPGMVSAIQQFNLQIPKDLPDSFVTQIFSTGSDIVLQVGDQQLSFSVYVR